MHSLELKLLKSTFMWCFLIGSSLRVFGLVIFYLVKLKRLTILMKAFLRQSFQGVFFVMLHKLVCG